MRNCKDREADLLLYKLGELSPTRRLATAWHLSRCPRCRERQARLAGVSAQFASVLAPPNSTPSSLGRGWRLPAWGVALILFIVLLFSAILVRITIERYIPKTAIPQDDGCRPGLPNDRCR